MLASSIKKIIRNFNYYGIKTRYKESKDDFNRILEFEIDGTKYWIEWWKNQSYLKLQRGLVVPHIPFKYINIDTFIPADTEYKYLCFYNEKRPHNKVQSYYNEAPFGAFKIPIKPKKIL